MEYTIHISVSEQTLIAENIASVNGTVEIIQCIFDFDTTWDAFPARQAIFKNSNDVNAYVMAIVDGSCIVPWEALKRAGTIHMAVVGSNTDSQVQRTETIQIVVQCKTLQGGVNGIEPTPDQYAQFIAQVEEMIGQAGVLSVNGMTGDVTLTASDVGALADTVTVPTRTSQLTNDSGFLTAIPSQYVTDAELSAALLPKANTSDLAAVATTGNYNDLSNKPTIPTVPTNVSAFTNDAGYLTTIPAEYVTDTELNTALAPKANTADLATVATSGNYNDLSNKPTIPSVPVQSVNGKTGAVVLDADDVGALPDTTTASDLGAYVKPSGGIPKSDLASAVQTSLGKADTALQSAPVTSVNGQTGAVSLSIPTVSSSVTAGGTDAINSVALIAYINSLDADNTEY